MASAGSSTSVQAAQSTLSLRLASAFTTSSALHEQDQVARLSAAHAEALRRCEQEAATAKAAIAAEADGRVAAANRAAGVAQGELSSARGECQTLRATLEQVPLWGRVCHADV